MSRRSRTRRRGRALLGLLAAVLATLGVITTPAAAAPNDDSAAKIEQSVKNALAAKDNADFWVMFKEQADLSGASAIKDWTGRGTAVVDALRRTANASQTEARAQLDAQKVSYQAFFIVNGIKVTGGSTELAHSLAKRANVTGILAPGQYEVPKPTPGVAQARINALEWGLAAINADDAWGEFGVRGEGVTVASIDSGADFTHPALVGKYRGTFGDGNFDHNYNWFDPAGLCPDPEPCDTDTEDGHGTHTMGTMVGDDGSGNQIGVAPNARWIAAAGCCPSVDALVRAGQWMLAPTDLNGENPRTDLRPNIVNNSWGTTPGSLPTNTFYKSIVQAWRASGIFPAFANGNSGSACETSSSPGDYRESYSVGAFDINGAMASFSSRGPGETGTGIIKPNLSAPGVNVRSSLPGGQYGTLNGTSMASPHMVGTVALMLSANPSLIGNVPRIEALLNGTAIDTSDQSCGGTPNNNNVWGEGKLDAFAAVQWALEAGTFTGTVTDSDTGDPIAGASVHLAGPVERDLTSGADGRFSIVLLRGEYTVSVSAFGFAAGTGQATVTPDQTATLNFPLTRVANGSVRGQVRDATGPVANAKVEILGTPIAPVTSAADGSYAFPHVPLGTYQARATAGGCFDPQTQALNVTADVTLDFVLAARRDAFGHSCVLDTAAYVEGDTPVSLSGDDFATSIPLPFDVLFYGKPYRTAHVTTNGHINFLGPDDEHLNVALPATSLPNAAIYPFWDDLFIDSSSKVMTKLSGTSPNREFVIEWRNARFFDSSMAGLRMDFEAVLSERGDVSLRYRNLDPAQGPEMGNGATVGIENEAGTDALQYSFNAAALSSGLSIRFKIPPHGLVSGTVTDFNDGQPVAGATVRAMKGTDVARTTTTAADGTYGLWLLSGEYTLEVDRQLYARGTTPVTIGDGTVSTKDVALHTPRAEVQGGPLSFLAQTGQLRTATLNLRSTSDLDLTYSLTSSKPWLWTVPGGLTVPAGGAQVLTVRVDPVGLAPGVHTATIDLTTNAGRTPTIAVPVTLVVPAYRKGVDAGATGGFTDANADAWVSDQAWSAGGFGYLGPGFVETTRRPIAGTDDDKLFQSQRSGMAGYKFDNLPAGTYQVELDFAELRAGLTPGRRVFDVTLNGTVVLPGYDPAASVGVLTADRKVFTVTVPQGGSIDVFFGSRKGKQPPIINSIRVTHRPDL